MDLLRQYLLSLLVTFQVVFQLLEVLVPSYLNQLSLEKKLKQAQEKYGHDTELSKEEVALNKELYSTFDDYLEMVVQFGHVTLFVAAFPLSPLCALVNNLTEMRTDAFKLLSHCKRPIPESAVDIGAWQTAVQAIAVVAVFTNVGTIVFTSSAVEEVYPGIESSGKIVLFLVGEQLLLSCLWLVEVLVDDIPEDVQNRILAKEFRREQTLLTESTKQLSPVKSAPAASQHPAPTQPKVAGDTDRSRQQVHQRRSSSPPVNEDSGTCKACVLM
eukprot:TRINITY_DN2678_c0_g1_i1.p1 TRINITY_DN2678_c0_g1~~TRINITY_DN2678_c0_g1_i1.p1  ORF type:complete len:272 (+),score=88.49 TRINITY_DN2678_c0_g1_i1:842-1657(+)